MNGNWRRNSIVPVLACAALIAACLGAACTAHANTFKIIYSFCATANCPDGGGPITRLLRDDSGNLFGTATAGGKNNGGVVFRLHADTRGQWSYLVLHKFCHANEPCLDGEEPAGDLIMDQRGVLYGTTYIGGKHAHGVAFELSPTDNPAIRKYKLLHNFCSKPACADGKGPLAGLTYQGAATGLPYDGLSPLYGTTYQGGAHDSGTVYQLAPHVGGGKWQEKVIYNFCPTDCGDGQHPQAPVIVDGSGNLYGTTSESDKGHLYAGVVFELQPAGKKKWTETVLHSFCSSPNCADGRHPVSGLLMNTSGAFAALLGTTMLGGGGPVANCSNGTDGCGVLFRIVPAGAASSETVLNVFCTSSDCADGGSSGSTLAMDSSGNVFGTTNLGGGGDNNTGHSGGGSVFQFNSALQVLHSFCTQTFCADGEEPRAGVVMDPAGDLFGTTQFGGATDNGIVFELMP